jgi:hypothetical protein
MKSGCLPPPLFRFALRLAFFAVIAQVALGIASAAHHARMAAAPSGDWEEICTPWGVERIALFAHDGGAPPDDAPPLPMLGECVLCAAAGLGALPVATPVLPAPDAGYTTSRHLAPAAPSASAQSLRPPVRAPPRLS